MDDTPDNRRAQLAQLVQQLRGLQERVVAFGGTDAPAELHEQIERVEAEIARIELDQNAPEELELVGAAAGIPERSLTHEINEITDPLLRLSQSVSPQERILMPLQYVLAEAGPRQAAILRRCAIPRWFDAGVLAVLRGKPDGNERLLDVLAGYSFVRRVNHTRFSYHDTVRAALLDEWRATDPDTFRAINQQLADYFQQRADAVAPQAHVAVRHLPYMTLRVSTTDEWELCVREALYHRLIVDPTQGMDQLRATFEQAEETHRIGDAEALIQLATEVPLDSTQQLWTRYLQARIDRAALRLDRAETELHHLSEETSDSLLAAKVQQTLGEVYAETNRWVQASALYRQSLSYFQKYELRQDAALTMLRLGEAYQEIARNSGGWHVPAYPQSPFWRSLGELWNWLLAVPFFLVIALIGRERYRLPRARYLASYQNWLLTWLDRTALRWYERARQMYQSLGDDAGVLRTDQRLAEILFTFGYHDEATKRIDQLSQHPAASDPYTQAWINRDRAMVLLAKGDVQRARALLDGSLAVFRALGDVRREAAVLALQSRADILEGNAAAALDGYYESLTRFRTLHYTAAREQVLYDLRAWQRRIGHGALSDKIAQVIADEPEKRYVARFPRSQRPLLQLLTLASLPLTLLLLAIFAPQTRFEIVNSLVMQTTYYNPWAALTVLVGVVIVYSFIYTAIGLGVIYLLPLDVLKREQPDVIITDPEGITRYDARGDQALRIAWTDVRQWIEADFRLWLLPLPLFSATLLEDTDGADLQIDGISGWYHNLQQDIAFHLQQAKNRVQRADCGFLILRSKMGALLLLGITLLLLFVVMANGWTTWLIKQLPPAIYAALALVAFSGAFILVPLAFWFANRPLALRRNLGLRDRWPLFVMAVGVASFILGLAGSGNAIIERVPALSIGLLLWGAYLFGDGAATQFVPHNGITRKLLITVAMIGAIVLARPQLITSYVESYNQSVQRRVELLNSRDPQVVMPLIENGNDAQVLQGNSLLAQARLSPQDQAIAYNDQGNRRFAMGDYTGAVESYDSALQLYAQMHNLNSDEQLRQGAATTLYNRGQALRRADDGRNWRQSVQVACKLYPDVAPQECAGALSR